MGIRCQLPFHGIPPSFCRKIMAPPLKFSTRFQGAIEAFFCLPYVAAQQDELWMQRVVDVRRNVEDRHAEQPAAGARSTCSSACPSARPWSSESRAGPM